MERVIGLKEALLPKQQIFSAIEGSQILSDYVLQIGKEGNKELRGVLISGHMGVGKTFFVEQVLQELDEHHAILIARHFQQHTSIPYYGFKYSISDYLSKIYTVSPKSEFNHFSTSLKNYLGDSFPLLMDYVPELSLISGIKSWSAVQSLLTTENQ